MDDGHVMASTAAQTDRDLQRVYEILQAAGFKLAPGKSDDTFSIHQRKEYLGFILDSTDMTVQLPTKKLSAVKELLAAEMLQKGRWRSAKDIASLVGKILALEPATAPVVQLLTRVVQRLSLIHI